MYKSKEKQKEANKEASKRYRQKQGMTEGMTEAPAIVRALVEKRPLLEYLSHEFKRLGVQDRVWYGNIDFKMIEKLLEVTG